MQDNIRKIGILGGTFNPVHFGHLIAAEAVREQFRLDRVLFIPVGTPPHKDNMEVIDARHRFEMVRLAVESNTYFEASRVEIDREGYTYSIDTLISLESMYEGEREFYFIIGADVVPELITWKDYRNVFKKCSFIAVLRPGRESENFLHNIEQMRDIHGARIFTAVAPLIDISSTGIRERTAAGNTIKYLVPDSVEQYILENGLYRL